MQTNGHTITTSLLRVELPEVKLGATEADLDALILQFERVETTLLGVLPVLDGQPDRDQMLQLAGVVRSYARFVVAHMRFLRELSDQRMLKVAAAQRERIDDIEDNMDDLADTLAWTLDDSDGVKQLIEQELAQ